MAEKESKLSDEDQAENKDNLHCRYCENIYKLYNSILPGDIINLNTTRDHFIMTIRRSRSSNNHKTNRTKSKAIGKRVESSPCRRTKLNACKRQNFRTLFL